MRSRRVGGRAAAVLIVAVLALVPACGGGDGGADDDAAGAGRADDGAAADPPEASDDRSDAVTDSELTDIDDMTDEEVAAEVYVAGYPLVVTVRTLQRLGGLLGVNQLTWQRSLAGPDSRTIVAPNRDTLYSVAVLDLRSGPVALTLPAVTDRYFTYQLLDAWTESFAYVGTRTTGGRAGTWVISPPGWDGEVVEGAEHIQATTPQVFLLGRFLVDDEADVAEVTAISERAALQPLTTLTGGDPAPPPPALGEPAGTPQDVPADAGFFDELGDALAVNPPTTDLQRRLFARAEDLGIGPERHPTRDLDADADVRAVLDAGAAEGSRRIARAAGRGAVEPDGGWGVDLEVGTYGDDTLLRALVARVGWGANVPEEAVYPVARVDADGHRLSGDHTYRITFPAGGLPPVDAFWSLSAYGADMFFERHPSGRYTVGDRTPGLVLGDDGSLEIVLSHDEPPAAPGDRPVNWLSVPEGRFVLMLRLYLPGQAILAGEYDYPAIERVDDDAPA